jgi:hypothetical protein
LERVARRGLLSDDFYRSETTLETGALAAKKLLDHVVGAH